MRGLFAASVHTEQKRRRIDRLPISIFGVERPRRPGQRAKHDQLYRARQSTLQGNKHQQAAHSPLQVTFLLDLPNPNSNPKSVGL